MADDKKTVEAGDELLVRDAIWEVSRSVLGQESVDQGRIRIRPFLSAPANISIKAGFTMNLGNYESGRADVMLSMPCYPEEIDGVYPQVKEWVDAKVSEEDKEMKKHK